MWTLLYMVLAVSDLHFMFYY